MTPAEAIRELMLGATAWQGDCADLAIAYVSRVQGRSVERVGSVLSVRAVTNVLGRPKRGKPVYGDLALHKGGLGICLGYGLLTVSESDGLMIRQSMPDKCVTWGVESG